MSSLLQVAGLRKRFGGLAATDGVDLAVDAGEVHAVIGPNGAGKTTLINQLSGEILPDAGTIHFGGRDITRERVYRRALAGIGRSYQIPHPFAKMTVFENLLVGAAFGARRREADCYDGCVAILARTGLLAKANARAGSLTLLERKRLELARALATDPRVLLLDEIAGGLTEHECAALVETIRAIHAAGTSIVWIEHIVHALLAVVGRLIVVNFGAKLDDGEPRRVMENPAVQEVYMGISAE